MGLLDQIRTLVTGGRSAGLVQFVDTRGMFESYVLGLSVEDMVRTQPNLRTVVHFLARNIAQVGVHTYQRVSDTDRVRERQDPVARLLAAPNKHMTTYELFYRWVADMATYDEALWVIEPDLDRPSGWVLQPIPPKWIQKFRGGDMFGPAEVLILPPGQVKPTVIPSEKYIYWHGWDPQTLNGGSSPINALKSVLSEQIHAVKYREQLWRRAGRVGVAVSRPQGVKWETAEQKRKFKEILDSKLAGDGGSDAGGSIMLDDGMTMSRVGFSAHEEEFVENAKLALSTVAQVYHVNPTMIGQLDNANFSNVREFRRMLYGETLGPIIAQIEGRLNSQLVPLVSLKPDLYVEFNIEAKLKGSFEEQAAVMSTLVGRPIFTLNEARSLYNKPEIEGGDVVVTPLNVLIGGQASPQDGVTAGGGGSTDELVDEGEKRPRALPAGKAEPVLDPARAVDSKDRAPMTYQDNVQRILKAFFSRQRASVLSALGAKAGPDWWDTGRWNRELGDDIFRLAALTATKIGRDTAEQLGYDPDDYSEDRTLKFLRAVSDSRAEAINGATLAQLQKTIEEGGDPADVFTMAEEQRSVAGAAALVTFLSAFATVEAGVQLVGEDKAMKKWIVNSKDPRSEHARMNGETVPVDQKFSNGADWPGDPVLGADGVAGCLCSVELTIP